MSDPLEKVFQDAQGWETPPGYVEDARQRGQRMKRARLAGIGAGVLLLVGVGIFGAQLLGGVWEREVVGVIEEPLATDDDAAAFAIQTVAEVGLVDIRGTFYDYTDIEATDSGWTTTFTRATCTKRTCTRSGEVSLDIQMEGESLRVSDVSGDADEQEKAQLVGQTQPADQERPLAEALGIHTYPVASGHTAVEATGGWLGPLSYTGEGAACDLIVADPTDSIYIQKNAMFIDVPENEDGRTGVIIGTRVPIGLEAADVRFACAPGESGLPEPGADTPCPFSRPAYTCAQAVWLKEVVENEGLRVFSTQHDALTFKAGSFTLQAWVMKPRGTAEEVAETGGYLPLSNSGAYSDGERIFWGVQNVLVFLAPTGDGDLDRLSPSFVARLKRESRKVPHPDLVVVP